MVIHSGDAKHNKNEKNWFDPSPQRAYTCTGNEETNPRAIHTRSEVIKCSWFLTPEHFCHVLGRGYLFKKIERA